MAYLLRLIALVGLVFLLLPSAQASFPATATNSQACTVAPCYNYQTLNHNTGAVYATFDTYDQACADRTAFYLQDGSCQPGAVDYWNYVLPGGYTYYSVIKRVSASPATAAYSCPADAILSGSSCTCAPSYVQLGSTSSAICVFDGAAAQSYVDQLNASGDQFCTSLHQVTGLSVCSGGVAIRGSGIATGTQRNADGTVQQCIQGPFSASGFPCGPADQSLNGDGTCKAGKVPGTVNGVTVCVTAGSTSAPGPSTGSTTPGTGLAPGAPSAATGSSSTTTCSGSTCTTTTSFTDSSGATVGTKTTSEDKATFCQENPKSMMCLQSSFSAACGSPPVCTGDAVFCAIASSDFSIKCALSPDPGQESRLYDSSKGRTGDQTADLPGNSVVNIGPGSFNQSNSLGVAAAGMSDLSVTVMGRPVVLEFSRVNPWLSYLGAVLMAVTFLLCIRIVTRG